MAEWRFYGREKEIGKVTNLVTQPHFTPLAVIGRRRIGKTLMLERVADSLKGTKPMVFIEVPDVEHELGEAMETGLRVAVRSGRLDPGLAGRMRAPLTPAYEGGWIPTSPKGVFRERLEDMIRSGIVVVLDEFPNGEVYHLPDTMRSMIDHFGPLYKPRPSGGLVLAGSHQQKMIRILNSDAEPLYGRICDKVWLGQLRSPVLLEMAVEHGWLERPGRFLTLYTAFGGIPALWEGFAGNAEAAESYRNLEDDDLWRKRFVGSQLEWLRDNMHERYDAKANVEMGEHTRKILLYVARPENMRGVREDKVRRKTMPGTEDVAFDRQYNIVCGHLEMLEQTDRPKEGRVSKLRVRDHHTLWQLWLLEHGPGAMSGDKDAKALELLQSMEGYALERLARDHLDARPEWMAWSGVQEPKLPEMDVLAILRDPSTEDGNPLPGAAVLGSCRRSPLRHDPIRTARNFRKWVEGFWPPDSGWRPQGIRWLAISPDMRGVDRARFRKHGFDCFDLRDMAGLKGPAPGPGEKKTAGPFVIPDPFSDPKPW